MPKRPLEGHDEGEYVAEHIVKRVHTLTRKKIAEAVGVRRGQVERIVSTALSKVGDYLAEERRRDQLRRLRPPRN